MALKSSYFISIDAAMDPNLLRFPEVVLEKLEVKMEDEETDGEDFLVESEMHTFPADDFPDPAETEDRPVTIKDIKDETLPCHASNEEAPVEPGGGSGSPECQGRRTGGEHYVVGADECRERTRGQRKGKGHRETSSIHGKPGMSEERGRLRGTHISMQDWSARLRTSRRRSRGRGARRQHWVQRQREGQGDRGGACVDEERLRGHRFTEEENEALVEGVLRRYEDLCGHSSVRGSSLRKRCFWQEIVNEVNSRGTIFRTVEVCKKRFADCRRVVKAKMAALEQQALGNGDLHEEIRFNTWEELLRHKITMVAGHGIDGMVDVCETSSFHSTVHWNSLAPPPPAETPSMGPAWTGIIDTAVPELEPAPLSDSDEATSPLNHLLGEWPEDDPPSPCIKSEVLGSLYDTPTLPFTSHTTSWTVNNPPEIPDGREYLRIQEDYNKRLRQLNRSRNIELHKLRGNVLQGSSSIAGHLEGLTREVRELNSHVRHMHMNQTHFNLMFQNYLSDTRQFYGSMVQALQNLHQAPTVSPMASPASSPAMSPKPRVVTPPPASPLMTTSSSSQSACAEAASASSTASEAMVCSNRKHGPKATAKTQPPRKC